MQLPLFALIVWLTVILFALLPKKLSILDFVFLYCVVLVFSEPTYTFFELNMHSVTVPRVGTAVFAVTISRLITIPLLILMAVDALQPFSGKRPHWSMSIFIWLGLVVFDFILNHFNIIAFHLSFVWQLVNTCITNFGFIALGWGFMRWFKRYDLKKVNQP